MHPNTMKCTETLLQDPMGWMGCVGCKKLQRDFVARTFALIAPVHPILHRVSCSYEMIPNAPKHYETHRNMSLGSNRVDQVCLLGKITTWLGITNFCINCTSSVCFAPSFMQLRNDSKCTQILWNPPTWLCGTNFCINCTSSVCFATSFMQLRNDPKCTQILRNAPKH